MNLRKTIKQRTFYDDKDYRDPHQDEVHRPTPQPSKEPTYKGEVIEFNPNLRPAAFPTIPLNQVIEESVKEGGTHVGEARQTLPSWSKQRASFIPPTNAGDLPNSIPSNNSQSYPVQQPSQESRSFDVSSMFTLLDHKEWSQKLANSPSRSRSRSSGRRVGASRPENSTYARNLNLMDKFDKRTDEEWVEAEMATSDEEECEEEPRGRQMMHPSRPIWDFLPVALQLDLTDSVMEQTTTLDAAFDALQLRSRQRLAVLDLLRIRDKDLDTEEQIIEEVLEETNRRLLNYNKRDLARFLKSGHKRLLRKHLYAAKGTGNYLTVNGRDLALAKAYLSTCGITVSLDHWTDALECNDGGEADKLSSAPTLDTSLITAETSRSDEEAGMNMRSEEPTLPPTTSFSVTPKQDASKQISSTASDKVAAEPPTVNGCKTTGLLRQPAKRRRSTIPRVSLGQSGVQENSDSTAKPQQDRVVNTTEMQAQSGKESTVPTAGEPYRPPPLALPYTLPPQLSSNQREWLPDGKEPTASMGTSNRRAVAAVPNMINGASEKNDGPQRVVDTTLFKLNGVESLGLGFNPLSQDPHRANSIVQARRDDQIKGAEKFATLQDAYGRCMQEDFGRREWPVQPNLQDSQVAATGSAMKLTRPTSTNIRPGPNFSSAPLPLQNPYARAYYTADYSKGIDRYATEQIRRQSTDSHASTPAPASSISRDQQSLDVAREQLVVHSAPPPAKTTKGNVKRSAADEDGDDEYVPVRQNRKMPKRAYKRRATAVS